VLYPYGVLDRLSGWFGGLLGRRSGGASASGEADDQLEALAAALRAVSPDFERYGKLAGDEAATEAARTVYAGLQANGKASRSAVVRELLVRLAEEAEDEEDAETFAHLSEREIAIVARRAGIPI
jgi:hypothetical protein